MKALMVLDHELNIATNGLLKGHVLQYPGIVRLLNPRKYVFEGSIRQRILSTSSSNTLLLLLVLASIGSLFYGAQVGGDRLRIPISYTIFWYSPSFIHLYLERFLWVFRNPFVRSSMGPDPKPLSNLAAT
jgi:hypothetical protein